MHLQKDPFYPWAACCVDCILTLGRDYTLFTFKTDEKSPQKHYKRHQAGHQQPGKRHTDTARKPFQTKGQARDLYEASKAENFN